MACPSQVHSMLHKRYYVGEVHWGGAVYQGRHEPLIESEMFERVQQVLSAHAQSGEHRMKQHHYLKGTLYCAHCGNRLIFGRSFRNLILDSVSRVNEYLAQAVQPGSSCPGVFGNGTMARHEDISSECLRRIQYLQP